MGFPKQGMYFEDSRKRVKRIAKELPANQKTLRLMESIVNQAVIHEGAGAKEAIYDELQKGSRSFSGAGTKQIGWGNGKRFGTGKWVFKNGRWEKV